LRRRCFNVIYADCRRIELFVGRADVDGWSAHSRGANDVNCLPNAACNHKS